MGQDKGLLPFHGKPLIAHIADRGRTLTDDLLVTTNQIEAYQFLHLPLYPDRLPQRGSLVGMHTALSASNRPLVAVVGCDMPFFSPQLLAFQAHLLEKGDAEAVVPHGPDGLEPLHGVYKRETCLAAVRQALERNIFSLVGWLGFLHCLEVPERQIELNDPKGRAFINLNTPEEYQWAESLLLSDGQ